MIQSIKFGQQVFEGLYWENPIPKIHPISPEILENIAGTYQTDRDFSITVTNNQDSLKVDGQQFPKMHLYPKSDMEFFLKEYELYFKFPLVDGKRTFQLIQGGEVDLTGKKDN